MCVLLMLDTINLFLCVCVYLPAPLPVCLSRCLSLHLSIYLSVWLPGCLADCISFYADDVVGFFHESSVHHPRSVRARVLVLRPSDPSHLPSNSTTTPQPPPHPLLTPSSPSSSSPLSLRSEIVLCADSRWGEGDPVC